MVTNDRYGFSNYCGNASTKGRIATSSQYQAMASGNRIVTARKTTEVTTFVGFENCSLNHSAGSPIGPVNAISVMTNIRLFSNFVTVGDKDTWATVVLGALVAVSAKTTFRTA